MLKFTSPRYLNVNNSDARTQCNCVLNMITFATDSATV